jgi:hypothetical protein
MSENTEEFIPSEDVEGHRAAAVPEGEDVEGHRAAFLADEEDVEGHVQPRRDIDVER